MKEVKFDTDLGHLVDLEGNKYEGKRICTISVNGDRFSTTKQADNSAVERLLNKMDKKNVDAYEIMSSRIYDSGLEWDSNPYSVGITAICYKKHRHFTF